MLYAGAVGEAEAGGEPGCCARETDYRRNSKWDYGLKGKHTYSAEKDNRHDSARKVRVEGGYEE